MIAVPPERKDNRYFALKCARIGLHVFPCRTDKRPISRLRWRDVSTTDVATIDRWWGKWPDALPAIDLGKSGLIVIDADRHEGGPDGVAAFVQLCADHQTNLADVPTVVTPSGGRHFYFKQRDGEPLGNGRGTLPLGVDVRGDGGYVIAPGAQLPDGGRYAWDDGTPNVFTTLRNGLAPVLPQAAEQIIARTNGYEQDSEHPAQKAKPNGGTGKSTTIRERAWAQAALVGCVKDLASKPSVPCGRNNLLNALAFRMGTMVARRWIERSTVEAKLFDAAVKCALVKDDGARTVRATIKSGLDNGEKEPHPDLKDRPHEKPSPAPKRGSRRTKRKPRKQPSLPRRSSAMNISRSASPSSMNTICATSRRRGSAGSRGRKRTGSSTIPSQHSAWLAPSAVKSPSKPKSPVFKRRWQAQKPSPPSSASPRPIAASPQQWINGITTQTCSTHRRQPHDRRPAHRHPTSA
jgi:hypothetical protein